MRVTLSLVLICSAGCARSSESVIANPESVRAEAESPRPPLGFSGYEIVTYDEPACAEVPMEERAEKGCLCAWGSSCACRYRVTPLNGGCAVEFDTERPRGEPRIRLEDGGVVQPISVLGEPMTTRTQKMLKPGQSTTICGR